MLQSFGEHIRGWFAGVVIGIIALAFVVWGLESYITGSQGAGAVVAKVNGIKISTQAFRNQVMLLQSQQERSLKRGLTIQEKEQAKKIILNQMIQRVVMTSALQQLGLNVDGKTVQSIIENSPALQENGRFSEQRLAMLLSNTGQSMADLLDSVRFNILTTQLGVGIEGSEFITAVELKNLYALWEQHRTFRVVVLPLGDLSQIKIL